MPDGHCTNTPVLVPQAGRCLCSLPPCLSFASPWFGDWGVLSNMEPIPLTHRAGPWPKLSQTGLGWAKRKFYISSLAVRLLFYELFFASQLAHPAALPQGQVQILVVRCAGMTNIEEQETVLWSQKGSGFHPLPWGKTLGIWLSPGMERALLRRIWIPFTWSSPQVPGSPGIYPQWAPQPIAPWVMI